MRTRRRVLNQRGFTLAELLVVTALVGLVMAGVLTLLMSSNQSYQRGTNQVEAQLTAPPPRSIPPMSCSRIESA